MTKRQWLTGLSAIALVAAVLLWWLNSVPSVDPSAPGIRGPYSTSFQVAEDSISEGGNWINGKTVGLNWANVRTSSGFAFGSQSGSGGYDDSAAVLGGAWGPNQTVTATIRSTSQPSSSTVFEEVELRLRTIIRAHSITGYEVNFSCSANPANFYAEIVRWNGPIGSFSYVKRTKYHCMNGDVVKASVSGSTIRVFVNNMQIMQASDRSFTSGNPGIGFFLQGTDSRANSDFGFSNFTATDEPEIAKNPNVTH